MLGASMQLPQNSLVDFERFACLLWLFELLFMLVPVVCIMAYYMASFTIYFICRLVESVMK